MNELLIVIGFALLPALGNSAGGMLAEFLRPSRINLNRALHAAAGIVLAIVAVELMPRALQSTSGWVVGTAFGLGGLAYLAVQHLVTQIQRRGNRSDDRTGMWMIYIAVAVDLFSDGLLIGAGTAVGLGLALVLALGQVLADIPEGFAAVANLRENGIPRRQRLVLSGAFVIPVILGAVLAYSVLRDQAEALKMATLTFTAGLLTVAAVEDMIGEAHDSAEDVRSSVLAMVGGFVLFTFVSAGLGERGA